MRTARLYRIDIESVLNYSGLEFGEIRQVLEWKGFDCEEHKAEAIEVGNTVWLRSRDGEREACVSSIGMHELED